MENEWGGLDSRSKYISLQQRVLDLFSKRGQKTEPDEIASLLEDSLECDFNTLVEDNSCDHVAGILHSLFIDCIHGKTEHLEGLLELSRQGKQEGFLRKCTGQIGVSSDDHSTDESMSE